MKERGVWRESGEQVLDRGHSKERQQSVKCWVLEGEEGERTACGLDDRGTWLEDKGVREALVMTRGGLGGVTPVWGRGLQSNLTSLWFLGN